MTTKKRLEAMADRALASGTSVVEGGIIAVPDVVEAEGMANGLGILPATWRVRRDDGREVRFYRVPNKAKEQA